MATNAKVEDVVDDDKPVTEEDLRDLKYPEDGVENSEETDEPTDGDEDKEEPDEPVGDEPEDEDSDEETSDFVKEFPQIKGDTPEEYAKNLEIAYKNSTAEAMRLAKKDPVDTTPKENAVGDVDDAEVDALTPTELYVKQQLENDIQTAFNEISDQYSSQVQNDTEYAKFVKTVSTLSKTIYDGEGRLAPPKELYETAAAILKWTPDKPAPTEKDKLNAAIKEGAASGKTSSGGKKGSGKSKVTDQMIMVNRKMYPGKTDAEIREELEPYV